ncbi:hypothetical protein CQW23_32510 [Capsicum baccatum]|uniref:Uncharacterized protein n=1 Tax=Capsicum baccatum TaxID=33114 RepID=A0A2G2V4K8_CAPBA|nr:hypothetical protein CQW23_32510 [Capsicum baccatum]
MQTLGMMSTSSFVSHSKTTLDNDMTVDERATEGLGVPIHRFVQAADSVSAKILRKTLGGGMQQIGVLCAAASVDKKILLSSKGSKISRTKLCKTLEQHGVLVLPEEVINKVREQCSSVPALKGGSSSGQWHLKPITMIFIIPHVLDLALENIIYHRHRKTKMGKGILRQSKKASRL